MSVLFEKVIVHFLSDTYLSFSGLYDFKTIKIVKLVVNHTDYTEDHTVWSRLVPNGPYVMDLLKEFQ